MSDSVTARSDGAEEPKDAREQSHGAATTPKGPTVKDKHCQYCHQPFTSSSLGRHLDQYLYKKKPDGIHDVEEIRRLRSTITRRTARNSSNKQESPEPSATAQLSPDPHSAPPLQLNPKTGKGFRVTFNQPSWHATGVINDIPKSSQTSQLGAPLTNVEPPRSTNTSNPESVRALELALQEVLDSIKAATSGRSQPQNSPFDFDVQSQTFPSLCLQALPPPPSLFSTHPFPSPSSFPLNPPTADQYDIVRESLQAKIQQWKADQLSAAAAERSSGTGINDVKPPRPIDPEVVAQTAQQQEELVLRHLELSLTYWISLPPETRRDTWQLEITRAFARECEKHKKAEEQLHRTQQEANSLKAQVEKLANCQWPREMALFPPGGLPLSPDVARELEDKESKLNSADGPRWDYDMLIKKWKRIVMHDKSMGRVGVDPYPDETSQNGPNKNQKDDRNAPRPNLPPLKGFGRMNPMTPNSPPSKPQHFPGYYSNNYNTSIPYGARDTSDGGESGRQPKRQRTHNDQPRNPTHTADGMSEHGQQQTQRLPSLSTASTPHSASSPFQPPPNPNGLQYPYPSSASTPSAGVAAGETGHNPYYMSSASDKRVEPPFANGDAASRGDRGYTYSGGEQYPHTDVNHSNGISANSSSDGGKIPSIHTMSRLGEHMAAPGGSGNQTINDPHHNPPGHMMAMYPRPNGP